MYFFADGLPEMDRVGESSARPFLKGPLAIRFGGEYLMRYSLPEPSQDL
jgi:hypothetical protein